MALPRLDPLPIDAALPAIVESLSRARSLVLKAPPGAGKTTRVPPALVDRGVVAPGERVLVLEPRRVAARAAARRIAGERGGEVGGEVGYQIRFDDRTSGRTRIALLTEGLLARRLHSDPYLSGVGAVVIDEFHERSIHADLALAFLRELQETVRPELALVVMSATLDAGPLIRYLGDCPALSVDGQCHPVDVRYLGGDAAKPLHLRIGAAVRAALDPGTGDDGGDVLVFLPGAGEIRRALEHLAGMLGPDVDLRPLYGDLSAQEQDAALAPGPRRKIVLATNIAQTSLTIEGVTTVIDSGLKKEVRHDWALGLDRLTPAWISRDAAQQRAGRAGRTAPGRVFRLWTPEHERAMPPGDRPEISRVDLAQPLLEVLGWSRRDPAAFRWFEAPPGASIERGMALLEALGALAADRTALTPLGETLRALPLHPRLGALLVEAHARGVTREGALAAALISERDVLPRGPRGDAAEGVTGGALRGGGGGGGSGAARGLATVGPCDLELRMEPILRERMGRPGGAAGAVTQGWARLEQMARRLLPAPGATPGTREGRREALGHALLAGYLDRVARRRSPDSDRFVVRGGRGAMLAHSSIVRQSRLIVAIEMEDLSAGSGPGGGSRGEALIRVASAIEEAWLAARPPGVHEEAVHRFDVAREMVEAVLVRRFADLVLDERPSPVLDEDLASRLLAEAARSRIETLLDLDAGVRELLARIAFLGRECPGALPVEWSGAQAGDAARMLVGLLPSLCKGRHRLADLRYAKVRETVLAALGQSGPAALARLAPERIEVPSGRSIELRYEGTGPPVLAVKLQEVFGLRRTPTVAGGRVKVKLELLGPHQRPVQVTQDLESFWANTYPQVRKDLRARYPKHAWPENPLEACPQVRPHRGGPRRG